MHKLAVCFGAIMHLCEKRREHKHSERSRLLCHPEPTESPSSRCDPGQRRRVEEIKRPRGEHPSLSRLAALLGVMISSLAPRPPLFTLIQSRRASPAPPRLLPHLKHCASAAAHSSP